jgi:hypothetical protein
VTYTGESNTLGPVIGIAGGVMNSPIADWANFFAAEVGASATLAGLIVIAISINLSRILSFPQLPARAAESLVMLIGALVLVSLGLVPGQPIALFGAEVLSIGLVTMLVTLYNQFRFMPPIEGLSPVKKFIRALANLAATLPFIVGGILLVLGFGGGFYWAAAGVLISLAVGVWTAWILLIEIMR